LDDCANPVSNATVFLSLSDMEADIQLSLVDATTGTYTTTWTPAMAGPITLTAWASSTNFSATASTDGTVAASLTPRIAPSGTLNNLNSQVGAPLAAGTVASIYGENLAGGTTAGAPGVSPLLTTYQGITATVGGIAAPLFYVSDGQLNVEIPYELTSGITYPVIVSTNNGVSVPDSVTIADASPGIVAFGDGTLVAQHLDAAATLVSTSAPAAPNETLQTYLVGMGQTTPVATTDEVGPGAEPLPRVANVTVTVNNENAAVLYAGLTPGAIALYQVDFTVPADIKTSVPTVLVTVDGVAANATILPVLAK
jgi:uncharacterized protein (TIGR03437 family)